MIGIYCTRDEEINLKEKENKNNTPYPKTKPLLCSSGLGHSSAPHLLPAEQVLAAARLHLLSHLRSLLLTIPYLLCPSSSSWATLRSYASGALAHLLLAVAPVAPEGKDYVGEWEGRFDHLTRLSTRTTVCEIP